MIDEKELIRDMNNLPFINEKYDHEHANIHFINGIETMYEMVINKINEQPKLNAELKKNK